MSNPIPHRVRFRTFSVVREAAAELTDLRIIRTGREAADYLRPFFQQVDQGQENFAAVFLDVKNRPIAAKVIFSGGVSETRVYPGLVARHALLLNAKAVIVAHSHPSGDLTPSREDEAVTKRIAAALATVEVRLLDHLVVSEDGRFRSVGGESG